MREAFLLLDFEDPATEPFKTMLLSCTLQHAYLNSEEVSCSALVIWCSLGVIILRMVLWLTSKDLVKNPLMSSFELQGRKFLSYLFGMHPKFVEDLHQTIKNQIPHSPK